MVSQLLLGCFCQWGGHYLTKEHSFSSAQFGLIYQVFLGHRILDGAPWKDLEPLLFGIPQLEDDVLPSGKGSVWGLLKGGGGDSMEAISEERRIKRGQASCCGWPSPGLGWSSVSAAQDGVCPGLDSIHPPAKLMSTQSL